MDSLPIELLLGVLSNLRVVDLASVAFVNRRLHAAAASSLFPQAVFQAEALHTRSDDYTCYRPLHEKVPLLYIHRVVQSGRLDQLRLLVAAGAHLGHILMPAC
ncbi:hypothetical protein ColLi_11459 [Colletotrichum liriopes]|uniref:F-box domain-containing protein n=1 Tax=Colletotrichum liriopes TaxID=708192 RepID=A0AA37GWL8_9PEZI|nr:hypothetical protein ColLi_11459 [Colletotrichum liriopes]